MATKRVLYHYNNNNNQHNNTNPPVTSQHFDYVYVWTQLEKEPPLPSPILSPSQPLVPVAPLVTPSTNIWPTSYCDERAGGMYAMQHLRFPTPPITPPRTFTNNSSTINTATTAAVFPTAITVNDTYIVAQQQQQEKQQQQQQQQQQQSQHHITPIPTPISVAAPLTATAAAEATTAVVTRTQSVIMKLPNTTTIDNVLHSSPPSSFSTCTSSTCSASSSSGRESTSPSTSHTSDYLCEWFNCNRYFENLDALAAHVTQIHAVAEPTDGLYYCRWRNCQRSERGFNARYKMLVHARTHTKEKPHTCQLCGKSFSRAENLKIHIRSHSGEKPYVCIYDGCNKSYSNSSDRFKHTRTHAVEKPYVCKVPGCQKRYTDPSSLRKHVKTFTHKQTPPSPPSPPMAEHHYTTHLPVDAETETELNQADSLYHAVAVSNNGNDNSHSYWPYAYNTASVGVIVEQHAPMELDMNMAENIAPLDLRLHRR